MESDIDHIHFLVHYIPRLSIAQMVRRLKQESTRQIWLLHPTILYKQYWYQHLMWSDGCFVSRLSASRPTPPLVVATWWRNPKEGHHLLTRWALTGQACFVCSIGEAEPDTIREYPQSGLVTYIPSTLKSDEWVLRSIL